LSRAIGRALEKDKTATLNAKEAKRFEDNQKLEDELDEALRKLEQKRNWRRRRGRFI
jgi:hypothetical protein